MIEALSWTTNAHSIQKNGRCMKRKWNNPSYLYIKMSTEQTPEAHAYWKANTWYLCGCWWNIWAPVKLQTLWQSRRRGSTSLSETKAHSNTDYCLQCDCHTCTFFFLHCFCETCRVFREAKGYTDVCLLFSDTQLDCNFLVALKQQQTHKKNLNSNIIFH